LTYHLLVGHPPFEAADLAQTALLHLQAQAPRPSTQIPLPPVLDDIVLRCLEKHRERRFPNVAAFLAALESAAKADATTQS
jgi:serine/threonine-protein kinase